jgi:hypothetical protein
MNVASCRRKRLNHQASNLLFFVTDHSKKNGREKRALATAMIKAVLLCCFKYQNIVSLFELLYYIFVSKSRPLPPAGSQMQDNMKNQLGSFKRFN